MTRRRRGPRPHGWRTFGLGIAALLGSEEAWAAGGAHVVDDAEVETPGLCHAENWFTGFGGGRRLANVSPACTFSALPTVEFGGSVQHLRHGRTSQTLIGPALKVALRPVGRGPGIGVALSAAVDTATGEAATAAVLVPVTVDLTPRLRANLNVAYQWSQSGDHHAAFAGAQLDVRVWHNLSLMAEAFVRDTHPLGFQAGLRWTPRPWIDVDLLGGHRIDGVAGSALTLGITLRG